MRALRGAICLSLAVSSVSACGSTTPGSVDEARVGVQVLRLRWLRNLGPDLPNFYVPELVEKHDRFDPIETSSAAFDTDKRRAFVGMAVGGLYCLDVRSGRTVWRYTLDDPVGSTPLYDADRKRVYFGADDGWAYALHARSGRLVWSVDTGAQIRRSLQEAEDTLYFANAAGSVFALDPTTGEIVWQHRRPPVEGFTSSGYADITIDRGRVFVPYSDGALQALDAVTGDELWEADMAGEVAEAGARRGDVHLFDSDATPVVCGDVVVAASVEGGLHGLDADSGNLRWVRPDIDRVTGLALRDGVIYAARSGVGLTAVGADEGAVLWTREFAVGVLQDPVVHDDVLLVSDSEAGLFAISSTTGEVLQRVDPGMGFFARPSLCGGYALIVGNWSVIYAMTVL